MTTPLTRTAASAAIADSPWRYLLRAIVTSVPVDSIGQAAQVARIVATACGDDADGHLRMDIRSRRVEIRLQTAAITNVTQTDVDLFRRISSAMAEAGEGGQNGASGVGERSAQSLEVAIDALDITAIRPFWRAVMAYVDEPGTTQGGGLVDPAGQGPALWFQQMDEPRPQRNRIHFDLTVPHDEALRRIEAALAAGGVMVDDTGARACWVLADPEGNEVCICTWQDRDPPT